MNLGFPGVQDAWESRFHQEFAKAIIQCEDKTESANIRDTATLGKLSVDFNQNQVNADYLVHFGYEKFVHSQTLNEKDVLLYRIANPETFVSTK